MIKSILCIPGLSCYSFHNDSTASRQGASNFCAAVNEDSYLVAFETEEEILEVGDWLDHSIVDYTTAWTDLEDISGVWTWTRTNTPLYSQTGQPPWSVYTVEPDGDQYAVCSKWSGDTRLAFSDRNDGAVDNVLCEMTSGFEMIGNGVDSTSLISDGPKGVIEMAEFGNDVTRMKISLLLPAGISNKEHIYVSIDGDGLVCGRNLLVMLPAVDDSGNAVADVYAFCSASQEDGSTMTSCDFQCTSGSKERLFVKVLDLDIVISKLIVNAVSL